MQTPFEYRHSFKIVSVVLLAYLCFLYLLLPFFLEMKVRSVLAKVEQYNASFETFSIEPLSGRFSLSNVSITTEDSGQISMNADRIDFQIRISGGVSTNVIIERPEIHIQNTTNNTTHLPDIDFPFNNMLSELGFFSVDEIFFREGIITYADTSSHISLEMNEVYLQIRNLKGNPEMEDRLVATAEGSARIHDGRLGFSIRFNPWNERPEYDLRARLEDLDLFYLDDYLNTLGSYPIRKGLFSMHAEASAGANGVSGFVQPVLRSAYFALNEGLYTEGRTMKVSRSSIKPFSEISFKGDYSVESESIWAAVIFTFRDAFLEGLKPVIQDPRRPSPLLQKKLQRGKSSKPKFRSA